MGGQCSVGCRWWCGTCRDAQTAENNWVVRLTERGWGTRIADAGCSVSDHQVQSSLIAFVGAVGRECDVLLQGKHVKKTWKVVACSVCCCSIPGGTFSIEISHDEDWRARGPYFSQAALKRGVKVIYHRRVGGRWAVDSRNLDGLLARGASRGSSGWRYLYPGSFELRKM